MSEEQQNEQSNEAQDQQKMAKKLFIVQLSEAFAEFVNRVKDLPCEPHYKNNAFTRFDEGMYWLHTGIQINPVALQPVKVPEAE